MPGLTSNAAEPIISTLESEASLGVIMTEHGPLPLRSVAVNARIDQLMASVQNDQGRSLRAQYGCTVPRGRTVGAAYRCL